jgi:hypothetical protein
MGILKKFLGGKKNLTSVLADTQKNLFNIYGISHPTDAQKLNAAVYLCIAGIAIINDLSGRHQFRQFIDELQEAARTLSKPLSMRVGELTNNKDTLGKIISEFPGSIPVTEATQINGLAAFEATYFSVGEGLMLEILSRGQGPHGAPGYAAIVVSNGILGEGNPNLNLMAAMTELHNFMSELAALLRQSLKK